MVDIEDKTIAEGRFLAPNEVDHSMMVVVLGGDVKDKFFPNTDAIGKTLKVGGLPFRVIGIEEKRGSFFGSSFDRHVYIPVTTHMKIFGRGPDGLQIHGKGRDREHFQAVLEDARIAMRNQHHLTGNEEDDFGIVNIQDLNQQIDQFTGSIALVVIPITLITLIVSGIVVMNIMLVSVTERTFEIGLRKAVGATRGQIVTQFLIESVFLCAFGGLLGLSFAFGFCALITLLTGITMTITVGYIVLSTFVSSFIGIIAGVYPAFKASHLDPITALCQGA
jgi:putative ABC transport system permease protein